MTSTVDYTEQSPNLLDNGMATTCLNKEGNTTHQNLDDDKQTTTTMQKGQLPNGLSLDPCTTSTISVHCADGKVGKGEQRNTTRKGKTCWLRKFLMRQFRRMKTWIKTKLKGHTRTISSPHAHSTVSTTPVHCAGGNAGSPFTSTISTTPVHCAGGKDGKDNTETVY